MADKWKGMKRPDLSVSKHFHQCCKPLNKQAESQKSNTSEEHVQDEKTYEEKTS